MSSEKEREREREMDADAMEDAALQFPKIRLLKSDTRCARFFFKGKHSKTAGVDLAKWAVYGVLTA